MCELLALSARHPTHLHVSMETLARHGGGSGPHRDGWGVAYLQDRDVLLVREPRSAHDSRCLAFLQAENPTAEIILAHVRLATQGTRALRNTQPFCRELGGRVHLFAHNGMLRGIEDDPRFRPGLARRVGETDSEYAFCALLERLRALWRVDQAGPLEIPATPPLAARLELIAQFAAELRPLGPANFLYTDGELVFAHGHRRHSARGLIEPPGMHLLCRACAAAPERCDEAGASAASAASAASVTPGEQGSPGASGATAGDTTPPGEQGQQIALVASVPLSDEAWTPLAEGEVVVLRGGRVIARAAP